MKQKTEEIIVLGIFSIIALTLIGIQQAYSGDYRYNTPVVTSSPVTNYQTTNNYQISSKGAASAIAAAQHNYYWGKSELQGSAAIGAFDSNTAFSFGLAKKYKKTLINGSVSSEDGKLGGGMGINWIF